MTFAAKCMLATIGLWACGGAMALADPSSHLPIASALVAQQASSDVLYLEHWIHAVGDDSGRPFAIVDKKAARIYVFAVGGRLVGASPTLLGLARGDVPVPGAGQKRPGALTTPGTQDAGRTLQLATGPQPEG